MIIYGAGGHAKVIVEILERCGISDIEIIEDNSRIEEFLGYAVHAANSFVSDSDSEMIIAIGSNIDRKRISKGFNCSFTKAIHPSAQISIRSSIGEGTVIMAGVVVNSQCLIGKHVILNTNCSIDHDCTLEDFVHISPNVALAGGVTVGEGSHIGIGASVIQKVTIGRYVTIGAGTVVIRDIPDHSTAVGNPARIIRCNNNE